MGDKGIIQHLEQNPEKCHLQWKNVILMQYLFGPFYGADFGPKHTA